jgi:hypothetical protein
MNKKTAYIIVGILLLLIFIQTTISMSKKSATYDEIIHLSAGYSYLKTRDFRLNPEHPPLIKELSAIPLLLLNPYLPLDHPSWINATDKSQVEFGKRFFYEYNPNPDQILFYGRIPIVLLSVLLGFFVFLFAKELYGAKAGLFALFLYAFSPNILAHSRLITTDLGISCFLFLAVYSFWKFIKKPSVLYLFLTGFLVGLTFLSKFTGIYVIPILFILAFFAIHYKQKIRKSIFNLSIHFRKNSLLFYSLVLLIILIGFLVIPLFYFFHFSPYFGGLNKVIGHSKEGHIAFLMGEHSTTGWWYYFIVAFLIKTPIPMLIFVLLTFIFFKKIKHEETLNELFLLVPIIFIFAAFMFNRINIGLRHILPVYPFLFVFVSKLTNLKINKQKIFKISFGILAIWYLLSSIFIFPHYLAYFNEFAGGPDNGYKYLIDSNIDWGQDFEGLQEYIKKHNLQNITIGYFGREQPELRGIEYKQLKCYPTNGIIAVSVNILQGLTKEFAQCTAWLRKYKPIDKIGYSIFIYNIKGINETEEEIIYCKSKCKRYCENAGFIYGSSYIQNNSYECRCK